MPSRVSHLVTVLLAVALAATGCAEETAVADPAQERPPVVRQLAGPVPGRTLHRLPSPAERVLARMTLPQRVGQLFMVGTPATTADPATLSQISRLHVGNVMLTGRSSAGTRTPARVVRAMQARTTGPATAHVPLFVATDQEGGLVQVLQGRHLGRMPTALAQGRLGPARLERAAHRWARQLRASGVNMNLAPVMDTVAGPRAAYRNPPIGALMREYAFTPAAVARHATAFARGMDRAGVAPTAKHFPGLGRVRANTDVSRGVVDRVTRRHDPALAPFRAAVEAGVPFVMMSTARYARLDPVRPAAFSPFVIGTLLRRDLGFRGVVVSDDLANARQVAPWPDGVRAVRFLQAGGNLVLTVNPATLPAMYHAVLARARRSAGFRARVDASALKVLEAKQDRHLLGAG